MANGGSAPPSGPDFVMGRTWAEHLKRLGMKWDGDRAAAMMDLVALPERGK